MGRSVRDAGVAGFSVVAGDVGGGVGLDIALEVCFSVILP